MNKYSIDRIEEGIAVCEGADGSSLRVRLAQLPDGAREGSVLSLQDGQWTLLQDETDAAREELFLFAESLFEE